MSANTLLLYYRVDPASLQRDEVWEQLQGMGRLVLGQLMAEPLVLTLDGGCNKLIIFQGPCSSHASLRVYDHGLMTLDIQLYVEKMMDTKPLRDPYNLAKLPVSSMYNRLSQRAHLSEEYTRALHQKIKDYLGKICLQAECLLSPVKRGQVDVWPYVITADERLIEQDFSHIVFDQDTEWQNVRIVHSHQWGNTLYLDADAMLAESDYIYTKTLCKLGEEDYKDKEILILGGGDGGILHELLKYEPAFVLMAEIDEVVIKACRQHMRSVCGDTLDNFEGLNYKIVIADCVNVLHECIQAGRLFDYVINDLTEFPVDKAAKGYTYDFETTNLVTELSLKAIKPTGKLFSRGNCISAAVYHRQLEADLNTLGCQFTRREVLVPSFCEVYCFYEILKPMPRDNEA